MTHEPTAVQPWPEAALGAMREAVKGHNLDIIAYRCECGLGVGHRDDYNIHLDEPRLAALEAGGWTTRELIARAEVAESIAERFDEGWAPDLQARQWLKITGWETEHIQPMTDAEVAWFEARRTSDTKGEGS